MNTKIFFTVLGVFLILIGVIGIGIFYNLQRLQNPALQSLNAAAEALESRDLETFKK